MRPLIAFHLIEVAISIKLGPLAIWYSVDPHAVGWMACHRDGEPRQRGGMKLLWGN